MTKVIRKTLPHSPSPDMFGSNEVRKVVQMLTDNICVLDRQVAELQKAVAELQQKNK